MESLHFPIVVRPVDGSHHPGSVPVKLEVPVSHLHSAVGPFLKEQGLPPDYYQSLKYENQQPDSDDYYNNHHQFSQDGDYHQDTGGYIVDQQHNKGDSQIVQIAHNYPVEEHNDWSAIPGIPGLDYPIYDKLPETHFQCLEHTSTPGFYADVDTRCQVWHYCQPDGRHDRFLCPNGTIFDQMTRVCNWWYNVHCDSSLSMYDINFDLYRDPVKLPSQSIDVQREGLASKTNPEVAVKPNSFESHAKEFSQNLALHKFSVEEPVAIYANHEENRLPYYPKPFDSSASHELRHYPVREDHPATVVSDHFQVAEETPKDVPEEIISDQRNALTYLRKTSDDLYSPPLPTKAAHSSKRKNLAKRKRYKVYLHEVADGIPIYRERKASPSTKSSQKLRIVRRRKNRKGR